MPNEPCGDSVCGGCPLPECDPHCPGSGAIVTLQQSDYDRLAAAERDRDSLRSRLAEVKRDRDEILRLRNTTLRDYETLRVKHDEEKGATATMRDVAERLKGLAEHQLRVGPYIILPEGWQQILDRCTAALLPSAGREMAERMRGMEGLLQEVRDLPEECALDEYIPDSKEEAYQMGYQDAITNGDDGKLKPLKERIDAYLTKKGNDTETPYPDDAPSDDDSDDDPGSDNPYTPGNVENEEYTKGGIRRG